MFASVFNHDICERVFAEVKRLGLGYDPVDSRHSGAVARIGFQEQVDQSRFAVFRILTYLELAYHVRDWLLRQEPPCAECDTFSLRDRSVDHHAPLPPDTSRQHIRGTSSRGRYRGRAPRRRRGAYDCALFMCSDLSCILICIWCPEPFLSSGEHKKFIYIHIYTYIHMYTHIHICI